MTKTEIKEYVEKAMNAGSCCPELKEACAAYLKNPGKEEAAALLQELKEDVCSIDNCIAFLGSDAAAQIFGDGQAAALKAAEASKAAGGKYCTCDACPAGGALLDNEADLLA